MAIKRICRQYTYGDRFDLAYMTPEAPELRHGSLSSVSFLIRPFVSLLMDQVVSKFLLIPSSMPSHVCVTRPLDHLKSCYT